MNEAGAVDLQYRGFWIRFGAVILDGVVLSVVTLLAVRLLYGQGYMEWAMGAAEEGMTRERIFFNWVLPAVYYIGFWILKSATIGKMLVKVKIVDAKTGEPASPLQCVVRYLGYIVSGLPLFLGFIWVAFDKKKQGWHDKIARTLVVASGRPLPH